MQYNCKTFKNGKKTRRMQPREIEPKMVDQMIRKLINKQLMHMKFVSGRFVIKLRDMKTTALLCRETTNANIIKKKELNTLKTKLISLHKDSLKQICYQHVFK